MIVLNKTDLVDAEELAGERRGSCAERERKCISVSAADGTGHRRRLKERIREMDRQA